MRKKGGGIGGDSCASMRCARLHLDALIVDFFLVRQHSADGVAGGRPTIVFLCPVRRTAHMEHGTRKPPGWGGRAGRCETSPPMRTLAVGTTRLGRRLAAAVLGRRGLMTSAAADCDRRRSGRGGGPSFDPPAAAAHRKPSRAAAGRRGPCGQGPCPPRLQHSPHAPARLGVVSGGCGTKKNGEPAAARAVLPSPPPPAHWPSTTPRTSPRMASRADAPPTRPTPSTPPHIEV